MNPAVTGPGLPHRSGSEAQGDAAEPVRVAIVDDDPLVRTALAAILGAEADLSVVGEAGDGADVPDLVSRCRPDVVLMDVRMPHVDGIAATARLASRSGPAVIVITTFEHDSYVYDALRAGARGFVLKRARPAELVAAVRLVATGEGLLFPEAIRSLAAAAAPARPQPPEWAATMTAREREVLALVARGLTNAEMAAALTVSTETVKTHVSALLAKSGARDRTGLVVAAYDGGLVRPGGDT